MGRLFAAGKDTRSLVGTEVYCIGPKTRASLKAFGIVADGMAQEFRAEGIVELLKGRDLSGRRVCLPRAGGARPVLVEALRAQGAHVDEIIVYDTVVPEGADRDSLLMALKEVDTALFTSPSGIRHAMHLLGGDREALLGKRLVAIGPVTAKAMEGFGLAPSLVALEYTDEGIIKALSGESS
jgi:uroporphyrinogen III methyltransferase/synthase